MKYQKLNVVIPMAGLGSRFSDQGYKNPKPLIDILGKPMIQWVIENLKLEANYIFVVQQSHIDKNDIIKILKSFCPLCNIVVLNGITDGAARSVLYSSSFIDNDSPLLIVNSDNMIEWDTNKVMNEFMEDGIDGGIITTYAEGPKWSYASIDDIGYVTRIAEKVQISNHATTGHYYWKRGNDFVRCARDMIDKNIRYKNEFYIAPVYNQAIDIGMKIKISECQKFWSVGTPEDLDHFLVNCDISTI